MLFSVIVPVYNVEAYLARCLDSILAQTFDDFELLIVDDGSSDGGGAICDRYKQKDWRVSVFHQKNQGLSGARNTGLDHAKGEWIVFVDSDDWISTDMLATLAREIKNHPADMYRFNIQKVDEDGIAMLDKLIFNVEYGEIRVKNEKERLVLFRDRLLQYKLGWEACDAVFRRSIIEEYGIRFRPTAQVFAEDALFTFQYMLHADKIRLMCELLYYYRQRGSSLVHSKKLETMPDSLYHWTEEAYAGLKREKNRIFIRGFGALYFQLLDHHIQYKFKDCYEEYLPQWRALEQYPHHRKWLKAVPRIYPDYRKCMVNVKWL